MGPLPPPHRLLHLLRIGFKQAWGDAYLPLCISILLLLIFSFLLLREACLIQTLHVMQGR